ncbi:EAL domain-containing protein [Treponema rectale]|uniref:Diguanylate cyclase (GGDEF)-like protein n=1 Tax=Treponema rectale TaxID=744512 RepID=A0A840SBT4_9SPIR|nr:EAL domain-containing protein [Treponema rectale]MBB5218294.1 diguanylate cyclase (GGDEF)-like protein [Treponema rectale]QOS40003.1 EAL domain-containing protein [Treponema rectale]
MSDIEYNGKYYYEPPLETQLALQDIKVHTFRYYPQECLMIASDLFAEDFSCKKFFTNTPHSITPLVCPEDANKILNIATEIDAGHDSVSVMVRSTHKNTNYRIKLRVIKKDSSGKALICSGTVENINEYIFSNQLIEALSQDYSCVYYIDLDRDFVKPYRMNPFIKKEYGYSIENLKKYSVVMDMYIKNSVAVDDKDAMTRSSRKEFLIEYLKEKGLYIQDFTAVHNGMPIYCRMKVVRLSEEENIAVMGFADISSEKVRELEKYAYVDPLTNGNNYNYFKQKIIDQNKSGFIVSMDIHAFKIINSVCGIKTGDEILKETWKIISGEIKSGDIAGHINGDYFALFINSSSNKEVIDVLEKIMRELSVLSREKSVPQLLPYFGITRWTPDKKIELCFGEANSAKKSIRDKKNIWYEFYSHEDDAKRIQEKQLEDSFERSLRNNKFEVWYQPKCSPDDNRMIGAEALIRWKQNDGSLISPMTFIPLFERNGMIRQLDEYVFRTVVNQQKKWLSEGRKIVPVSINLSRVSLYYFDIVEIYRRIIEEKDIDPKYIPIEITESAAAGIAEIKQIAEEFHNAGFSLHMDDFGSGYSSLALLNTMHFDTLKLDKSLVDYIGNYGGDRLLDHTIALAKELGMHVTAEGVEKKEQVDFLNNLDCDSIQGFYYSKPLPLEDFEQSLGMVKIVEDMPVVVSRRKKSGVDNLYLETLELLVGSFHKIMKINLTTDSYQIVKIYSAENSRQAGYSQKFSTWISGFADSGNIHADDLKTFRLMTDVNYLKKYFNVKKGSLKLRYRRLTNGEYRWVLLEIIPAKDYEENNQSLMLYVQDINDSYKAVLESQKELEQFCNKDSLTGLYSFHYFNALCHAYKTESSVTDIGVVFCDINGLSMINETRGHKAGNITLCNFAKILENNFGSSNCFRISGDEFIAVIMDTPEDEFIKKASEFRDLLKKDENPAASCGWYWKENAETIEETVEKAEFSMYHDKKNFYSAHPEFREIPEQQNYQDEISTVIQQLAAEYHVLGIINFLDNSFKILKSAMGMDKLFVEAADYDDFIKQYAKQRLRDEYIENFILTANSTTLRKKLKESFSCDIRVVKKDNRLLQWTFVKSQQTEGLPAAAIFYVKDSE